MVDDKFVNILFETTPDMLAILDKDGKVIQCNNPYLENFGYGQKEIIGMVGPVDMVCEHDRQKAVSAFEQVVTEGLKLNVPLDVIRKDRSVFPSIWSGAILKDDSGKIEGYLVTGKDLTVIHELKNDITQLKIQNKKEKLAVIGELSSRLAHDIRNPLSIIQITVENLKTIYNIKHPIQKQIEKIERSIDRITHQINDVLIFVGGQPLKLAESKLQDIIANSIESLKIPNNVTIILPKNDVLINVDGRQLSIVLNNLIHNSIQAMDDAGTIILRFNETLDNIIIEVEDSGSGIKQENIGKIFEPLFTNKQTGTGLGLASVKSIIDAHGGTVSVTSPPTIFTIILPKSHS